MATTQLPLIYEDACGRCGREPKQEEHTCPYQEDVNNDHETLCTCCEYCQGQCADDI